jgi:hypothetical protein
MSPSTSLLQRESFLCREKEIEDSAAANRVLVGWAKIAFEGKS